MGVYCQDDLRSLLPRHAFFVGVDSDGCVFDSMTIKQCDVFHPLIIRFWGLASIEGPLRETAEFVNLRSVWRGRNRFFALLKTFELLVARDDVKAAGVALPEVDAIRAYVESGVALGNPTLEETVARDGDPELRRMLSWSLAVNRAIEARTEPIPPFAGAVDALRAIAGRADTMVVSQTPEAALVSEWREHGIDGLVRLIAGQEIGTKAEQIRLAAIGKYAVGKILLIGDAPGDLDAAREAGVRFYPIVPGHEVESWRQFNAVFLDRFLAGEYGKEDEDTQIEAFLAALPEQPDGR
jgi:phosphoglycolate phosphatase-like HAD superfamily hydrolase